jgi:hypothetical protein
MASLLGAFLPASLCAGGSGLVLTYAIVNDYIPLMDEFFTPHLIVLCISIAAIVVLSLARRSYCRLAPIVRWSVVSALWIGLVAFWVLWSSAN